MAVELVSQAGWKFEFQTSGRFVGDEDGMEIVAAIEDTIFAMFDLTSAEVSKLDVIWRPLLAKGPLSI